MAVAPTVELSPTAIRSIFAGMLADETRFHKWWPLVTPSFFSDPYYKYLATFVDTYYYKYMKPPSVVLIEDRFMSDTSLTEDDRDLISLAFADILDADTSSWLYYEEHLKLFVRKKAFEDARDKSEDLIEKLDFEGVLKLMIEANAVATARLDGTVGFFTEQAIELRFDRRTDPKYAVKRIATHIGNLDSWIRGGLKPKTLSVFVATTGKGKSTALVHFGRMAVLQAQKVLHITLELEESEIVDKYDSCFTGIKQADLEIEAGKVREIFEKKYLKYADSLRIVEKSEYSLSPSDLVTYLNLLQREGKWFPDVLIVDYADLMTGGRGFKIGGSDRRHELNHIYTCLHAIAKDFNLVVATATQANRGAINKKTLSLVDIAEDISKAWVADHIFCVSQEEHELRDNKCRIFIAKNRGGPAFHEVTFMQDLSRATFAVMSSAVSSRIVPVEELAGVSMGSVEDEGGATV